MSQSKRLAATKIISDASGASLPRCATSSTTVGGLFRTDADRLSSESRVYNRRRHDRGSPQWGATGELAHEKLVNDPNGKDRYGRTIADVALPDGRNLNHELVRAGLAWWFRRYPPNDTLLERLEGSTHTLFRLGIFGT